MQRGKIHSLPYLYTRKVADLELKATIGGSDMPQGFPCLSPHAILRSCCPDVGVAIVTIIFAFGPVFVAATRNLGDVSDEAPVFQTRWP